MRDLIRSEPLPAAGVAAAVAVGVWHLFGAVQTELGARKLAAASVGILLLLHLSRRDARFLTLAGHAPRRVFSAEYVVLLLPVAGMLLLGGEPWLGPGMLLAVPLIAAVPTERLSFGGAARADRPPILPPLVPPAAFEWISGLRRTVLLLVLLYALAIPSSAVPGGPIALLILGTWVVCGYYTEGEGWPLLQVFGLAAGGFLRRKIGRALGLWFVLSLPWAALFLARHAALWPILLVALTGCAVVLAGSVIAKYAAYREGRALGAVGSLVPVVLTGALLIPPVAVFLLLRLWRMAIRNLDPYLHALD